MQTGYSVEKGTMKLDVIDEQSDEYESDESGKI